MKIVELLFDPDENYLNITVLLPRYNFLFMGAKQEKQLVTLYIDVYHYTCPPPPDSTFSSPRSLVTHVYVEKFLQEGSSDDCENRP